MYIYFEYDGYWYMADNLIGVRYNNCRSELVDYIRNGGTFRLAHAYDEKENYVKARDIAAFEMLSDQLYTLLRKIRKYNPTADICMSDGKIELYSYKFDKRVSASSVDSKKI